ncbi:hypothetical protein C8T65DRAFT_698564 [Cerioporus squamosus]|nr:hypothetical protein C8T65DRAFT_698564 [Cerioporus squamosus]
MPDTQCDEVLLGPVFLLVPCTGPYDHQAHCPHTVVLVRLFGPSFVPSLTKSAVSPGSRRGLAAAALCPSPRCGCQRRYACGISRCDHPALTYLRSPDRNISYPPLLTLEASTSPGLASAILSVALDRHAARYECSPDACVEGHAGVLLLPTYQVTEYGPGVTSECRWQVV